LKHFIPVYISPQVTIAKYYEGAKINGTVFVGSYQYNGAVVYVMDDNGIPHDYSIVENGEFNVIAPAGNISLSLYINVKSLDEEIHFSITEDEGRRNVITNRTVDFQLDLANVNVTIKGINETMTLDIASLMYPAMKFSQQVISDNYTFNGLIPSDYTFTITNATGAIKYEGSKFLNQNENEYHIEVE